MTGLKLYYAFSDLVDLHFYVVNSLYHDTTSNFGALGRAALPGAGFRLGFNWGSEGNESTVGVSGLFGPSTPSSNKHEMFGGDLDLNWWITEAFALGGEGYFVRANASAKRRRPDSNGWSIEPPLRIQRCVGWNTPVYVCKAVSAKCSDI